MSKPIPTGGHPLVLLEPAEQIKMLVDLYSHRVNPGAHARLTARVRDLGLIFPQDEFLIIAALDTPLKVQEFLDTQVYYNNDHAFPGQEETALPPRRVLQSCIAHCFEGAVFAYAVNFLHGYTPQMVLLEASQDVEHNLMIYRDAQTGLLGVNAHSAFPLLDGRPAQYRALDEIIESYRPYYYSDRVWNFGDLALVGYSEPFDLVSKYGARWIASEEPLWEMYYTYIDDTVRFHYLDDNSDQTHDYPLIHALIVGWIRLDTRGRAFVSVNDLPRAAQELWHAFWRVYDPSIKRPDEGVREIEGKFFELTRTAPVDLQENADELQNFLDRGYRLEQLLSTKNKNKT